jgi:hypothetical protein
VLIGVISCLEGVPAYPYIVWGIGLHGSPSRIQAQESYASTFRVVSFCSDKFYYCSSSPTTVRVVTTGVGRGLCPISYPKICTLCTQSRGPGSDT